MGKALARSSRTLLVLLLLLAVQALAQHGDGRAAPGRWCTLGGSPSRSGASRGEPLRGPVAVAWTHDAGGTIEGEPLVWDDTVVIAVKLAENRRALRFLDLLSGEPLARDWIANLDRPIEPSLWGERVVVRKAPTTLTCVQLRAGRAYERWTRRFTEEVGPPLIVGDALYATVGGALERMTIGKNSSVWRVETQAVGRLSLRGNRLLSLEHFRSGYHRLVERDAETGAETAGGPAYPTTGLASASAADVHPPIPVFLGSVRGLTLPGGWPAGTFGSSRCVTLEPDEMSPDRDATLPALMREYVSEPVPTSALQDELLGVVPSMRGALLGLLPVRSEGEILVLATGGICPDFLRPATPPTVVGNVALIGARAFDLVTHRVLWRAEPGDVETSRAIPARGSVLYVRAGTELVALRSALLGGPEAPAAPEPVPELALPEASLVMRDGTVRAGSLFLATGASDLRFGKPGLASADSTELERIPLVDVLLVEDPDQVARWAPDGQGLVRGLLRLADVERGAGLAAIANEAKKLRDPDLAELALEAALDAGSEDRSLDKLPDWIATTRSSSSRQSKSQAERALELRARLDGLSSLARDRRMDAHDRLAAEAPPDWRFALVRSVLEEDPRDARAVAVVRAAIPESIRPAADAEFDSLDWLAFVEAESQTPLKVLFPPERETPDLSTSQRLVGRYANVWRKDIIGLESDNLLILSPVARPGAIARCLAYGEALCAVLEEMFALAVPESGEDLRGGLDQPLVLQLFASRDEYLSGAGDPSRGPEAASGLSWTAGHYDAKANVSRIFVPDDDRELDSVLQTYLHELTHHWLQMKCPLYSLDQTFARTGVEPGFWVVEGFASMVEEFRVEPRTRPWIAENSVSRNLDLVANAGDKAYVPWKLLFGLSQARFWALEGTGKATIPSTTRLGAAYPWTAKAMFYAQSAATARWLWLGEEGRNRLVLLEFVRDFYTGKAENLDLAKRLGRTPDEIGRAIAEYARAQLSH